MRFIMWWCLVLLLIAPVFAEALEVKAKLMKLTAVPKLKDIDNYSRALSVYEYEVDSKKVVVLKWSIWQRRVLDDLPTKLGSVELLKIAPLSDFKEYSNDRIIGEIEDKASVLYLDLGSIPKAVVGKNLVPEKGLARRGVKKDWLFLNDDIRHMNTGEFWKKWDKGGEVDPLDVVLDFQRRLKTQGVGLVLVPVPSKASIYRDFLVGSEPSNVREGMVKVFEKNGVAVVDLRGVFLKHRKDQNRDLYCKTDSHWSPEGCDVAAQVMSAFMKNKPWYAKAIKKEYDVGLTGLLEISGDLLEEGSEETVPLSEVSFNDKPVAKIQPNSPVVLLGDSHTLVFGDDSDDKAFFADGGGLADCIALHSGVAVDVVASLGSGMNTARGKLYRSRSVNKDFPDYWQGKKLVIWCFSEKEFSNPAGLSIKIPVVKP